MLLKQLRLSKHLTQAQLAMMSGLSIRTIQRILY
ncbi:helix-turn-helix domain-containing protein [Pseudoalteromonas rubra]|nr:helix-turn-helix transcriptional regulator [Pseudoalteromonas rubra]